MLFAQTIFFQTKMHPPKNRQKTHTHFLKYFEMQNCQLKPVRLFSTILKNDLWKNNDQVKISDMWSFDSKSNGWDWINADLNKMQPSFDDFFTGECIVPIFSEFHDSYETPSWKSTSNIMKIRRETNDLDHISEMWIPVWTLNIFGKRRTFFSKIHTSTSQFKCSISPMHCTKYDSRPHRFAFCIQTVTMYAYKIAVKRHLSVTYWDRRT